MALSWAVANVFKLVVDYKQTDIFKIICCFIANLLFFPVLLITLVFYKLLN